MPKQWWSSPAAFAVQAACLLALFAWSVDHAPAETRQETHATPAPGVVAAPVRTVIDNSEDTASTAMVRATDPRFVAPPTIRFRTENPPAGSLNLRPLNFHPRENERTVPWQPMHPQNPPQRLPTGPRTPFEVSGLGATVYNAPPAADVD